MKIKNKNLAQVIIQAISLFILFLPCVYSEEAWVDISGYGTHHQLKNETLVSFFRKLFSLDNGQFIGILFILFMAILMILLLVQVAKHNHIQLIPSFSVVTTLLFFFYSLTCTQESWDSGLGPSAYYEYSVAFGFVLIISLQIAITLIGFISNSRIKQNGIIEEDKMKIVQNNISNADELGKYKKLLDDGVITQEEFDAKKKQLLEL